jgi:signal transduction histidine kinase
MFKRTLWVLTLQYSILLLLLFTIFSGGIYKYMDYSFGGDYRKPEANASQGAAEVADAGLDRLRNALLISYGVLVVLLPGLSYALAKRALIPVEKSFEEQQRFVDDASHELRTPLSILQGELELALMKSRSAAVYRKAIQTSLDEVEQLTALVNNLLLMARGDRKQFEQLMARVDLNQVIQANVTAVQSQYATAKLNFKLDLGATEIEGIESLISQAIYNVLDNAAKFSPMHGTIKVTSRQDADTAMITISDNGIGMTKQQAAQAFNRFWRADSSRSIKGFGLGLALVRQIVSFHNGQVHIDSAPHKRTSVNIQLSTRFSR